MNIKYHIGIGIIGEAIFQTHGLFFIGAIFPDLSLVYNEYITRVNGTSFEPDKVDNFSFIIYHLVHSLFMSLILLYFSNGLLLGHLFHIIPDWFTHTGRFSAMPFYPISKYKIKFGREVLK